MSDRSSYGRVRPTCPFLGKFPLAQSVGLVPNFVPGGWTVATSVVVLVLLCLGAVALVHVAEATSTSQRRLQSTVYILSRLSQYAIYWLSHLDTVRITTNKRGV